MKDLNDVKNQLNKIKNEMDVLKKKRFDEFMDGFQIISTKLKETYQVLQPYYHIFVLTPYSRQLADHHGR